MDPAEFLTARLDEEHARLVALLEAARHAIEALKEPRLLGREIPGWHSWPDVEAMCSRALRDVAAKRAILAVHGFDTVNRFGSHAGPRCLACLSDRDGYEETWEADPWPCQTLRVHLAVYDGHPDYRDDWKP